MTVLGSVIRISELFSQELLGPSQPGALKDDSKITFHSQPILNAKTAIFSVLLYQPNQTFPIGLQSLQSVNTSVFMLV